MAVCAALSGFGDALRENESRACPPIYEESLVNGIHHTHNHDLLREISEREGYADEIAAFLKFSRNSRSYTLFGI